MFLDSRAAGNGGGQGSPAEGTPPPVSGGDKDDDLPF